MKNILLTVGGGEVLNYLNGGSDSKEYIAMDDSIIKQLGMLSGVKILIMILLVFVALIIIMKLMEVRSPFRGKAITSELDNLEKIRKHDESIIRANKMITSLTKIIENSPFNLDKAYIDYWTYNLERANIRIPGGYRVMKAQELNAIIKTVELGLCALLVFVAVFINLPVGAVLIILTVSFASSLPMMYIRGLVKTKDNEIVENFADFYLMLHYVLLASAGTPISGIMKSFDKTTSSEEMHRFVDVCIHYIDTYGEYDATRYIAKQYREIPEVGKLMRLIRQANEGGDVRAELVGFRTELLSAKKYAIQKRMEKVVMKAKASFNILTPILIQAIISAMAIYMDDLSLASTFM